MIWKVNGKVVKIKKNKRLRQRNGRSSLLRIKEVVKADSGMYQCIASNDYGSVSKLLNLTVVGRFVAKLVYRVIFLNIFEPIYNSHMTCDQFEEI